MILRFLSSVGRKMAQLPKVVFVLGGPGAGKGTQCEHIVKEYGYIHLSAGELLREERKRPGSKVGEMIESHIQQGKIVPVEVTCGLLEKAMEQSGKQKFLIDGFPRNKDNFDGWTRMMGSKSEVQFVLYFSCDEQVCIDRCLKRGESGSGRSDDNLRSLRKRIVTYNSSTKPIIDHYEALGLVKTIDASKSIEKVFDDVRNVFS